VKPAQRSSAQTYASPLYAFQQGVSVPNVDHRFFVPKPALYRSFSFSQRITSVQKITGHRLPNNGQELQWCANKQATSQSHWRCKPQNLALPENGMSRLSVSIPARHQESTRDLTVRNQQKKVAATSITTRSPTPQELRSDANRVSIEERLSPAGFSLRGSQESPQRPTPLTPCPLRPSAQ